MYNLFTTLYSNSQHNIVIQLQEEPGRQQFMGSQRVGHDLVTEQQQQIIIRGKTLAYWNSKKKTEEKIKLGCKGGALIQQD